MLKSGRIVRLGIVALIVTILTGCYAWTYMGSGDYVNNYDNRQKFGKVDSRDWPVTLIFYGPNATVGNVRTVLNNLGSHEADATALYMRTNDAVGEGYIWDSEPGNTYDTASGYCIPGIWKTSWHIRFYADHGYALHNTQFGNYVVATTHQDIHEGCGQGTAAYPESSKDFYAYIFASNGFTVDFDAVDMGNAESGTRFNDGRATLIYFG